MANELITWYPTGNTLYAHVFNGVGQIHNGAGFEAPVNANYATYDVAAAEAGTMGVYRATMPTAAQGAPAGVYGFMFRLQAGGAPATTDIVVAAGAIQWDGAAEVALADVSVDVNAVCACVVNSLLKQPAIRRAARTGPLEIYRGDTWEQTITGLGDLTAADEVWFTAKRDRDDSDALADIKISSVDGLEFINRMVGTPANGSVTVVLPATSGEIEIRLEAVETAKLTMDVGNLYWDVQWKDVATGDVQSPKGGLLTLVGDVTRET